MFVHNALILWHNYQLLVAKLWKKSRVILDEMRKHVMFVCIRICAKYSLGVKVLICSKFTMPYHY